MRVFIIANPYSHGGYSKRALESVYSQMKMRGVDYNICLWTERDNVINQIKQAQGFDAVVAVGGDGTINTAVNGIMNNPLQCLPLGVVYCGTSPDFCLFHKLPINQIEESVDLIVGGAPQPVDVMRIKRINENGDETAEYFCCSSNLGMGASVAAKANRFRRWVGDKTGTFFALILELIKNKKYNYQINNKLLENVNHLLISKMPYIASGLKINVDLSPSDGRFALCYLQNQRFWDWFKLIWNSYSGKDVGISEIHTDSIYISSSETTVPVEYDGDPHGFLPIEVSLLKQELLLIK